MIPLLRGLTLTHPWPLAFLHLGKLVENRSWHPARQGGEVGMSLALHGGAVPTPGTNQKYRDFEDDWEWILDGPGHEDRLSQEHLLWLSDQCTVVDKNISSLPEGFHFRPGIVAVATLAAVTRHSNSPWAADGQWHWILTDFTALPSPVPHRGAQGLWELEQGALEQVEAQLGRQFV